MDERRYYRGGFVWPIILIGAGIVFLLNTQGLIGWNVWESLLQLWPVLLIAIGLDILFRRRFPLGSALLALLLIVVLVLAVQGGIPSTVNAGSLAVDRTETISQDLQGRSKASVEIGFGAGSLNIGALTEGSPKLIQGTVDLSRNEQLNKSYSENNGAVTYALLSHGSFSMGPELLGEPKKKWELGLSRDVPLDLKVSTGAGKSTLDLTGLNLQRLEVDGGVGQVTVKLPAQGQYPVSIDGGVGKIVLIIPQGVAARVDALGGLGGVSTEGNFRQNDRTYTTGDYGSAANQVDVQVKNGVGQIVLKSLSE